MIYLFILLEFYLKVKLKYELINREIINIKSEFTVLCMLTSCRTGDYGR